MTNGTETDIDCGGPACGPCPNTKNCMGNGDCASTICFSGTCVECNTAQTCPGSDTACAARTCRSHVCGRFKADAGTATAAQSTGDCRQVQCDGDGGTRIAVDNADLPPDDGVECTQEICGDAGVAHPPKAVDTACTQDGGSFCSAASACVACNATPQCGGTFACVNNACVDPCVGFACNAPPVNACTGAVATTYASPGACSSDAGTPSCSYTSTSTDCSTNSKICVSAACVDPLTVGFCRLQYPGTISDVADVSTQVFGRVYVSGITDQSGVNNPDPRLQAQLGYGTGPQAGWSWDAATPNASYGPASPGYEANNDEYQATLTIPAAPGATQSFAYRFSGDNGQSWTYCDFGNAGSSDGFTTPGVLRVMAPYFSEYVEGSSNNKAVEIYNPGSVSFLINTCSVEIYTNGSFTASSIALNGPAILPGAVHSICNGSYTLADAGQCDQLTGSVNFNGNDAVALRCSSTLLDVIGQIGVNPGTAWTNGVAADGGASTVDNTLLRRCSIFSGDRDAGDPFDPLVEWKAYPIDTSLLGGRNCPLP